MLIVLTSAAAGTYRLYTESFQKEITIARYVLGDRTAKKRREASWTSLAECIFGRVEGDL